MSGPGSAARVSGPLGMLEHRAPWVAALVALVAALLTMTSDPIGVFNDDGIYLLTAKALAEGQGYVYPHLPGTPPAIHYPPMWPALLAFAWRLAPEFPANIGWFKLINPVILAAASGVGVVFAQRVFGLRWWVALGGVLAATVTVPVLLLTNLLLSEPLFLLWLLPTLWVAERMVREGGVRTAALAAVLVAGLVLVRTLGGVVLVSGAMLLVWERRWRELAVFAGLTVLLLLPWQLFVWRATPGFPDELRGSYGPYLEWVVNGYREDGFPFFRQVVRTNLAATWGMVGTFVSPLAGGVVRHLLALLAVLGLCIGLLTLAPRGRAPVTALAMVGYLGVVVAWPFWVDRFYWVMWPLLVPIALAGAAALIARVRTTGRPRLAHGVVVAVAVLALGHEAYNVRGLARGWASSASATTTMSAVLLVRHVNGDPSLEGRLLATELAPMVALYTGLQVVPVEILTPQEHVRDKSSAERTAELERIHRRYHPEAYVMLQTGPFHAALREANLDRARALIDVSPEGALVRIIKVQVP